MALLLDNIHGLAKCLEKDRVLFDEPMSRHTTLGIGGIADLFYEAFDSGNLIKAIRLAKGFDIPVTVIGSGSNILVSDKGIRGLVIKNHSKKIDVFGESKGIIRRIIDGTRWIADSKKGTMKYDFADLDYDESDLPRVSVVMDSGVNLQYAILKTIEKGLTGLQWYSRIPGTIGGAVYNNIHGGTHMIDEVAEEVVVINKDGEIKTIKGQRLGLDYDKSRFHKSGEIILQVKMNLYKGDDKKAKAVVEEWRKRKSIQPMNSAGCVFKNISKEDCEVLGYPTCATGYLIEHVLNMTGFSIGGAAISKDHHNFIVNIGNATAKDYLAVRDEIVKRARETVGLELEDEIIKLGDFNN